jgi:hypothetical protein
MIGTEFNWKLKVRLLRESYVCQNCVVRQIGDFEKIFHL